LESIDSKLAESAISLKEAQKGREETVSCHSLLRPELTPRTNERNYSKPFERLMKLL
jgi:hypothetical protein